MPFRFCYFLVTKSQTEWNVGLEITGAIIRAITDITGDVFILSSAQIDRYRSLCTPIDGAAFPDRPLYKAEGETWGVCVYDEALGVAVGTKYVAYISGERYYLFFNAASRHLGDVNGAQDDAALRAARTFLSLP